MRTSCLPSHLFRSSFPLLFSPTPILSFLFNGCPSFNHFSPFYLPLLFSSHLFWLSFSFLNMFFASLLPPIPLLLSLFTLSSFLPGCGVMYGSCQGWNQWDAGCFNLAWEPGGSRSSASWKSDGSGLSRLCFYSPPSVLPQSLH